MCSWALVREHTRHLAGGRYTYTRVGSEPGQIYMLANAARLDRDWVVDAADSRMRGALDGLLLWNG